MARCSICGGPMNELTFCPECWDRIVDLKAWLMRNRIEQKRIAQELGVSRNLVWMAINGYNRNRRVLRWLREHGCPEELLPPIRPEGRDAA